MRRRVGYLPAILSFSLLSIAAPAQTPRSTDVSVDQTLALLSSTQTFREVTVSPDGSRVAWVESIQKGNRASTLSAIYVADIKSGGTKPRLITAGKGREATTENGLTWSPDSKFLAFLSDHGKSDQMELYMAAADGGSAKRLTDLTGFLADPRWSPDGKTIAILFTENAPRAAGPLQPATIETGLIEDHIFEQRLTLVDVASGRSRQISPPDLYVYEYDWAPDSQRFVAVAAHGSGDNNWYIAEVYTIPVAGGEARRILIPNMQIAVPRWSPDGRTIAFIGGLMSDEQVIGGDIFTIPAGGGEPRNVTPRMTLSASWLAWSPAGDEILFTAHTQGASGFASVKAEGGSEVSVRWTGAEAVAAESIIAGPSISCSRDKQICAAIRQSFQNPPEVWAGPVGQWRVITHANGNLKPVWGEARSMHWENDGLRVQGWLVFPRNYDPAHRYPMIVSVHGGPSSSRQSTWPQTFFDMTVLSKEGYFVFFPNPRGSYGQGEEFTRGNVKDFGYGDLRDINAGVDQIVKTLPIDNDRIGITGWSYGGYMTMWTVTQTNRYRAAVAGAGIANWQSYYGQNGIDQWMIPFFGASVYDDPAVYAKSAPITFIKNVKTPTLILVGDRDIECPTPQSYEFWHALKTLGVKNQFVVYENEGHRIGKWEHRVDIMKRTVAWFDELLSGRQASTKR
jgi:dipeptidyl aminopeptidase/acylaminoacyl peptidase